MGNVRDTNVYVQITNLCIWDKWKTRNMNKKNYKWISIYYIMTCFLGSIPTLSLERFSINNSKIKTNHLLTPPLQQHNIWEIFGYLVNWSMPIAINSCSGCGHLILHPLRPTNGLYIYPLKHVLITNHFYFHNQYWS